MPDRNGAFQSQQQLDRVRRRVGQAEAVDFFNLLTGPELLEMTGSLLPEHREQLYDDATSSQEGLSLYLGWCTDIAFFGGKAFLLCSITLRNL